MNIDFHGKTVLVTGATRGIGKAIADEFAALGASLLLTGTKAAQIKKLNTAGKKNCKYFRVDFSNPKSTNKFLEALKKERRIDVCVNNAGINKIDFLQDVSEKDWDRAMTVNLKAPFLVTQAVSAGMKKRKYGRIINIASIFSIVSKQKRVPYTTTKFGLKGFTVAASNELASCGILVNTVSPGFVLTDLTKKNLSSAQRKKLAAQVPVGRFAEPAEIAKTVVFLASEENTYLTGKNIVVDGGFIDA